MQTDYKISYDKLNEIYTCNIEGEMISAEFVIELLEYIGKLYQYHCWYVSNLEEYKQDLERDLKINIVFDFEEKK